MRPTTAYTDRHSMRIQREYVHVILVLIHTLVNRILNAGVGRTFFLYPVHAFYGVSHMQEMNASGSPSGTTIGSILFFNQSFYIFEQFAQVFFDDAPYDRVVNAVVAMYENIPERRNVAVLPYFAE